MIKTLVSILIVSPRVILTRSRYTFQKGRSPRVGTRGPLGPFPVLGSKGTLLIPAIENTPGCHTAAISATDGKPSLECIAAQRFNEIANDQTWPSAIWINRTAAKNLAHD